MKARIKSTGEWVELTETVAYKEPETMECKETINGRIIPIHDLEFEQPIDWEQRRYEITKSILSGSFVALNTHDFDRDKVIACKAVRMADYVIELLKRE